MKRPCQDMPAGLIVKQKGIFFAKAMPQVVRLPSSKHKEALLQHLLWLISIPAAQ